MEEEKRKLEDDLENKNKQMEEALRKQEDRHREDKKIIKMLRKKFFQLRKDLQRFYKDENGVLREEIARLHQVLKEYTARMSHCSHCSQIL